VPVGLFTNAAIAMALRESEAAAARAQALSRARRRVRSRRLRAGRDFLGALEVVLDRGLEDDWFGSSFIITFAAVRAVAFVLMIPSEISRRDPMIDLRMVARRQFGVSFLVMLAIGAILLAATQSLPQLVQQNFGYTATWAGLVLSPGGLITMAMMFVVGSLSAKSSPNT
jgi:DHA2 family multidrug resistance protein